MKYKFDKKCNQQKILQEKLEIEFNGKKRDNFIKTQRKYNVSLNLQSMVLFGSKETEGKNFFISFSLLHDVKTSNIEYYKWEIG